MASITLHYEQASCTLALHLFITCIHILKFTIIMEYINFRAKLLNMLSSIC